MLNKVPFAVFVVSGLLFLGLSAGPLDGSVGNASVKIYAGTNPVEEFSSATLIGYGEGKVDIAVKLPGRTQSYILSRPLAFMRGWSASIDDSNNTVTVTGPDDLKYMYYENCNHILTEIKNINDVNVVVFDYNTTTGLIDRQSDGFDPNLCIEYGYDGNLLTTLTACDYSDCRQYTITYDSDDRAIAMSSSCESCGGYGNFQYEYDADDLLTKVKDANAPNVVIYEYVYNSVGWVTDIYLGEANDGNHVREFHYAPIGNGGGYIVNIYDYVDVNTCRVTREHRDGTSIVTKRTRYESLNEDPDNPAGNSFTELFVYEYDTNRIVIKKTVIPPSAGLSEPPEPISGVRKEYTYDPCSGSLLTEKWFDASDVGLTVSQYSYEYIMDGDEVFIARITDFNDARGAVTQYYYDGNDADPNLKVTPQVTVGISGTQQLKYEYEYDSRNRVTLEKQLDINDVVLVQTKYEYDNYGNLIMRYDDFDTTNEEITEYRYNGFGEMTRMKLPSDVVSGRSYTAYGKLESEFVLANPDDINETEPNLISQTKYFYNTSGRLAKTARAKYEGVFDFNNPSSWIETEYEYDLWGNRTKVIEDANDVSGLALVTTYEYNHQGKVTKITLPNGKWTETVRDGRGLVAKTIVGHGETTVATTEFYYDDNGNLEWQITPNDINDVRTGYKYDDFDRLIEITKGL